LFLPRERHGRTDEFGSDLRDDRVPEGAQDSHSVGYPIRWHHAGWLTSSPRQPGCFAIEGAAWFAVAVGVARKINPVSDMILADTESRKNRRPDFVTQWLHVIADAIKPSPLLGNLLAKDFSRTICSNEGEPVGPSIFRDVLASRRA
jgi:hypothetical protein